VAANYIGFLGSGSNKTNGTGLNIAWTAVDVAVGDDIFVSWAGDPGGSSFGISHSGTATISWSDESTTINSGNVETHLFRGTVTGAGTISGVTVTWTSNIGAKALVAGHFSGIGTRDDTGSDTTGLDIGPDEGENPVPWQIDDLVVVAGGSEGPGTDDLTAVSAGSIWSIGPTEVGQAGTTGGGAAGNITSILVFGVASTNEASGGGGAIGFTNNSAGRDSTVAGAVYSPSAPASDAQAEIAWAELEVPNQDARADIAWAEFEIPTADARADIAWTEFEVPTANAQAELAWAELEVPFLRADAEVAWAEVEVPNANAQADISFVEFEVLNANSWAEVAWAEVEVPTASSQAEIAHTQFEVPDFGAPAEAHNDSWERIPTHH